MIPLMEKGICSEDCKDFQKHNELFYQNYTSSGAVWQACSIAKFSAPVSLFRLLCLLILTDNLHNIIIHDKYHQNHEYHEACKMHKPFFFGRYRLSTDYLKEHEYKPSAVQRREG